MSTVVNIGTLIERSPEMRGGRPRISGTGVTVQRIVIWYKLGLTAEEIVREIPHLTLAQVYAALSYYHANKRDIEEQIASDDAAATHLEQTRTQDSSG